MDLALRKGYLGGTDVAAILGLSPYRAPIDVWREKVGLSEGMEQTERMRLGQLLEEVIADAYTEQTGRKLRRTSLVRHPDFDFLAGNPDRLVVGERGVFEAKASATSRGYSDDDVPPHVRVQANWYCGLTERDWCDVVLLAGMGLRIVRVDHDAALFRDMSQAAVEWWQRHVVGNEEPEPDGSESYRKHLSEKYPRDAGIELVATPEQALLADELRYATALAKSSEEHKAAVENRLRAAMGDATALIGADFRVTWKVEAGRPKWKDIAEEAGATPELIAKHTPEGQRVFRPRFMAPAEEKAA